MRKVIAADANPGRAGVQDADHEHGGYALDQAFRRLHGAQAAEPAAALGGARERGVHRQHGHFGRHDKAQDQRVAGHQFDSEQLRAQERRPEGGSETEIGYQGGPELRPRRRRNAVGLRDT
jgi:hypothetical protein